MIVSTVSLRTEETTTTIASSCVVYTMRGFRQKLHDLRFRSGKITGSRSAGSASTSEIQAAGAPELRLHLNDQIVSSEPLAVAPSSDKSIWIQSQVWNEAYDELRKDEPGLADAYERILSGQIASSAPATEVEGLPENIIKSTAGRQDQLKRLIEEGQARTERVATFKGKVNGVIEPFNHLRSVISMAVKNDPMASIAWVGVTAVIDVCAHCFISALCGRNFPEA